MVSLYPVRSRMPPWGHGYDTINSIGRSASTVNGRTKIVNYQLRKQLRMMSARECDAPAYEIIRAETPCDLNLPAALKGLA